MKEYYFVSSILLLLAFTTKLQAEVSDETATDTTAFRAMPTVSSNPTQGTGTASAEGSSGSSDGGYTVHVLSDGGASATATARVIRIKVNGNLTD